MVENIIAQCFGHFEVKQEPTSYCLPVIGPNYQNRFMNKLCYCPHQGPFLRAVTELHL